MLRDSRETKAMMEALIAAEIRRLIGVADLCVFALYDPSAPEDGPIDYRCHQRCPQRGTLDVAVDFDFEGIGVWYICNRRGETFRLRHILVEIEGGRFRQGQVGTFEGYWDEFPQFVAEDRWVKACLAHRIPRAA